MQVNYNGIVNAQAGLRVTSATLGHVSIAGGLRVTAGGVTIISGSAELAGALSITGSSTTRPALDINAAATPSFLGNGILATLGAGATPFANALTLARDANILVQVRAMSVCAVLLESYHNRRFVFFSDSHALLFDFSPIHF